jgi:hypothetical protein
MIASTVSFSCAVWLLAATASGAALAAGGGPKGGPHQPTPISGLSPYPDGGDPDDPMAVTECNGAPQTGVVYRNSETEPYIAVNPTDPDNMIAA